MPNPTLADVLAGAFLAGDPTRDQIVARAAHTLGRRWPFLNGVAQRYVAAIAGRTRPRHRDVVEFLNHDPNFTRHAHRLSVAHLLTGPPRMQPVVAAASWDIPEITTTGALAAWLGITPSELAWFADLKDLAHKRPLLTHYHYRVLTKRSGAVRLIESPKPRLKHYQRQIRTGILDHIPPHPAVHGFRKHRSIQSFVAPHTGRRVVLRMDLTDFFPTFAAARIQAFFRTAGYPEPVADLLGGICTNAAHVPGLDFETRTLYGRPHLPQGAPTSPALANLCFYRVDRRLRGLAESAGAVYTRYADDLAFSSDAPFDRHVERFSTYVAAVLLDEGFHVNHHKTRIMHQCVRQRLAGLVANQRINIPRPDFDTLKATLTNCIREGPDTQNRAAHPNFRAHVDGRIAFMESVNPTKAQRLRALFSQIRWP